MTPEELKDKYFTIGLDENEAKTFAKFLEEDTDFASDI